MPGILLEEKEKAESEGGSIQETPKTLEVGEVAASTSPTPSPVENGKGGNWHSSTSDSGAKNSSKSMWLEDMHAAACNMYACM